MHKGAIINGGKNADGGSVPMQSPLRVVVIDKRSFDGLLSRLLKARLQKPNKKNSRSKFEAKRAKKFLVSSPKRGKQEERDLLKSGGK